MNRDYSTGYSPARLVEIVENGNTGLELGNQTNLPGFWIYSLHDSYRISMDTLDPKDLKTVYETFKIIQEATEAISQYKLLGNFSTTHDILGNLLETAVKRESFTALYHLITEYGAPVAYRRGVYLAKAVNIKNWNMAPVQALVKSGRLNTFLQNKNAAYNLICAFYLGNRGDFVKHIVEKDTRENKGSSKAYTNFLYDLVMDSEVPRKRLTKYLLENVHYTVKSLSDLLERVSNLNQVVPDLNLNIDCVTMVVNQLYKIDSIVAISTLQTLVYASGSKYLYTVMMKRLQLENNRESYIRMIKIALYRAKFNNRTILNLYRDCDQEKGLLSYFTRGTLELFIKMIDNTEPDVKNVQLKAMLGLVLKTLVKQA
jgi:hypothetical protein